MHDSIIDVIYLKYLYIYVYLAGIAGVFGDMESMFVVSFFVGVR